VDPIRPNMQLQNFFLSLARHPKLTPEAVKAVEELSNNALAKKYPLTEKTLRPASKPEHYERVAEAFEKSLQGIGRPWWKRFFGVW